MVTRMIERAFRLTWLMLLVGQGMMAILWWVLAPGGFPFSHPRFWSNTAAPPVIFALTIATIWAFHRRPLPQLQVPVLAWIWAWSGLTVAAAALFPITLHALWLATMAVITTIAICTVLVCRERRRTTRINFQAITTALASLLLGASLMWTQNPPPSRTHPYNHYDPTANVPYPPRDERQSGSIRLDPHVMIQPWDGSITVQFAPLTLEIQPLLTFISRSPDGAPTVLVDAQQRETPRLELKSSARIHERAAKLRYEFFALNSASLQVESRPASAIDVEATSNLTRGQVFSHLNSFCDFEIRGHSRLSLEFSPCAGMPVEVLPSDYPFGRPARFAFVDSARNFRVVQATSGEKGPFHDLAQGRLERDQPLTITLLDLGRPVAHITLDDWSSQADTTLSPAAGWGVPVNAIEFSLSGDAPSSPASIFVTLAATSVGRGWDCVGHQPGVYRNRIHVTAVPADPK
jgi:hypothetical protein